MKRRLYLIGILLVLLGGFSLVASFFYEGRADTGAEVTVPDTWVASLPDARGMTFRYPETVGEYISTAEWPPTIRFAPTYTCVDEVSEGQGLQVEEREIDGRTYCVRVFSEGAAGSTYVSYDYETKRDGVVVQTAFTLRFVQCMNYDEPKRGACGQEQQAFDADLLAERIIASVVVP